MVLCPVYHLDADDFGDVEAISHDGLHQLTARIDYRVSCS